MTTEGYLDQITSADTEEEIDRIVTNAIFDDEVDDKGMMTITYHRTRLSDKAP